MVRPLQFILGRSGIAVAAVPRETVAPSVAATPTASARRSAAQPKTKNKVRQRR